MMPRMIPRAGTAGRGDLQRPAWQDPTRLEI